MELRSLTRHAWLLALLALLALGVPAAARTRPAEAGTDPPLLPAVVTGQVGGRIGPVAVLPGGDVAYADGPRVVLARRRTDRGLDVLGRSPFLPGEVTDLTTGPGTVYATWRRGLAVLDITSPQAPRLASLLALPYAVTEVAVDGTVAYLGGRGVWIVAVDDPDAPRVLQRIESDLVRALAVHRQRLFLAYEKAVVIYDVAVPNEPAKVAEIPVAATDLAATVDALFVASGGVIRRYDTRDAAIPLLTAHRDLGIEAAQLEAQGDRLFVTVGTVDLCVLDTARADSLTPLGCTGWEGLPRGLTVDGSGRAYVTFGDFGSEPAGLRVLDIRNPPALRDLGSLPSAGVVVAAAIDGDRGLLLTSEGDSTTSGLRTLSLPDLADPAVTGWLDWSGDSLMPASAVLDGATAYVLAAEGPPHLRPIQTSLRVVDIADPARPVERLRQLVDPHSGAAGEIQRIGDMLVATVGATAYRLDVTSRDAPRIVDSLSIPLSRRVLAVRDGLVVAGRDGRVQALSFSAAPATQLAAGASDIARLGNWLAVSTATGLDIYELETAEHERLAAYPVDGGLSTLAADESHVYALSRDASVLWAFEIVSGLPAPVSRQQLDVPMTRLWTVTGTLYGLSAEDSLYVIRPRAAVRAQIFLPLCPVRSGDRSG